MIFYISFTGWWYCAAFGRIKLSLQFRTLLLITWADSILNHQPLTLLEALPIQTVVLP